MDIYTKMLLAGLISFVIMVLWEELTSPMQPAWLFE